VEDARQNFASSNVTRLPPLPLAPLSRSGSQSRGSRLPRKPLAANQIFASDGVVDQSTSFCDPGVDKSVAFERPLPLLPLDTSGLTMADGTMRSPPRQRRATVSTRSPEPVNADNDCDPLIGSPSKRKEKSRSQGNLMQPISPISQLEYELQRREIPFSRFTRVKLTDIRHPENMPTPAPRLSAVLDRSLFITPPLTARDDTPSLYASRDDSSESNDLTSSPFHVEPYPPRKTSPNAIIPDTPSSRRLEGVYDRFLMATSGVKRLGRGYQSDNAGPVLNNSAAHTLHPKRNPLLFASARRRMPPPVSSEDHLRAVSAEDLGAVPCDTSAADDKDTTAAFVRRAFKAIITGTSRTVSRREL
jgi:serine/threonine-protein kinase GIN4